MQIAEEQDGHLDVMLGSEDATDLLAEELGQEVERIARAADRGHVDVIRELLQTPIAIDHVNRLGWTALLEVIILGDGGRRHAECVRLLLAAGANPNLANGQGVTPLAHARRRGQDEVIRLLEAAGAR